MWDQIFLSPFRKMNLFIHNKAALEIRGMWKYRSHNTFRFSTCHYILKCSCTMSQQFIVFVIYSFNTLNDLGAR